MTTPNTLPANGGVSDASREAFEAVFPMPSNCVWTGNGYAPTDYNAWDAQIHSKRWEGWRAAQSRPPSTQSAGVREAALEEAAKVCEGRPGFKYGGDEFNACAKAIRERIGTPPAGGGKEALSDAAKYRLLVAGDLIEKDDEFIQDDGVTWLKPVGWEIGAYYGATFKAARRRIDAAIRAGKKG